ncbi:MAG: exopolysaccharide biosynthesis protein [Rheinheimera sp.]|uniref:XrtA-associated tyrosine autokinase n=1 Tax=Arsukibacterium sp. UBA3155 TaxID=1946058 RepID=UPI000C90397E|nr:XrtA-associated tyrosine autokinase [Arsukibacterium sp. UBA3155]MAD74782.1 exopolysaccharide biosynthesis protein [Rheinheimera sp.]|tara:strand:- start:3034 stop:3960 length:927 start_codon:yes stop_codon:yes gene_type:complete
MSTIEKAVTKLNRDSAGHAENHAKNSDLQTEQQTGQQTIVQRAAEQDVISAQAEALQHPDKQDGSAYTVQLDLAMLEKKNFVSLSKDRRLINEEYRVIKRKLINNAFGALSKTLEHPNLILVSSSRPGEGKTFSAINLALSIALEQDKTVLLVDADVLRPNVSKTLHISHHLGLTDYLQSTSVTVPDILLSTNVERLKIITAGSPHHLSTELLASERMSQLVDEFATRYPDRIVIFDAPPLLGVNETAVMAAMCGQAVIVVEENRTRLAEIEQSVSLLPKEMAVGFLINKAHRNQGKGYGYGYYYGAS